MKSYTAQEQDGGLWFVYDKNGAQVGAVFNRGYIKQDRVKNEWIALSGWNGCESGTPWGIAKTFSGAVSLVFKGSRYCPKDAQAAFEKVQSELQNRAEDFWFLLENHGAILS